MIKKIALASTAISLLFLTGCGQPAPDLDDLEKRKNNISDASKFENETVTIDENSYGSQNDTNTGNNSSSDGFQSVYFAFGDYSISLDMEENIAANVNNANSTGGSKIKIEGNCDEFGTDEYNYALGLKRAKAVKDSMVSKGINAGRIVMVSLGESNPICSSPSDTCYQKNRRVDLRLVK